jgi:uncharacterized protein YfkK (UPF0435 family)
MGDEAEPVVEDTTKTVEVVEDAAADAKEKTGGEETPKPGTPDKAMQKMQQELGNVTRQLEALQEKKEAGQQLTEAEKAKLAKAEQRLTKIRQFVARPERNEIPSEADDIAEEVLDIREKVNQQEALKTELERTQDRLKKLENERNWRVIKEEYKGLDTDAIWDKALSDALETLGETGTQETVERVASAARYTACAGGSGSEPHMAIRRPSADLTPSARSTSSPAHRVSNFYKKSALAARSSGALTMGNQNKDS